MDYLCIVGPGIHEYIHDVHLYSILYISVYVAFYVDLSRDIHGCDVNVRAFTAGIYRASFVTLVEPLL